MSAIDRKALDGWIHGIGQGNRDALAQLYRASSAPIYAYAFSILKNRHDAEDVLHDCFVTVCTSAESYQSQGKPMAWLLTVARNLCYKRLREQKRDIRFAERGFADDPVLDAETRLLLGSCMAQLGDEEHQIVVLHVVAGMKHREIGAYLQLPLSTVLSRYNRAIRKLNTYYRKECR